MSAPEPAETPWYRFFCAIRLLAAQLDAQEAEQPEPTQEKAPSL